MNLLSLILYGIVNVLMVRHFLSGRGRFYEFPFWAGALSLGWFFPQAIGGYLTVSQFPESAYAEGMFFATLCTGALWFGFSSAVGRVPQKASWLNASFDIKKLFYAGALLCLIGFFFQWKLKTLPEELTSMTQWSGAAVKYLFLANIFLFGFITLWLLYLSQPRLMVPKLLIFIVPSLLLILDAAFLSGRRSAMMNLVSYLAVSLWFVRRIAIPRWIMLTGLIGGLILINAIGTYRSIMRDESGSLKERVSAAAKADYKASSAAVLEESGSEFKNYIYYRLVCAEDHLYDYGFDHWNRFVFNFVPGQIIGRELKSSLLLEFSGNPVELAESRYGHKFRTGSTATGYLDAFESFGWLGFVKFIVIGWVMGVLYRLAMQGHFLAQLLYVFLLGTAMHAISHSTHRVLVSTWVYFFALGYPVLSWAKIKWPNSGVQAMEDTLGQRA